MGRKSAADIAREKWTYYKLNYKEVKHAELNIGDEVYFDNYEDGKFPRADPKISGPFVKAVGNVASACFEHRVSGKLLVHSPDNLLVKKPLSEQLLNREELAEWLSYQSHLRLMRLGEMKEVGGVQFHCQQCYITFCYKQGRSRGIVRPDSYVSRWEEPMVYEPKLRISCQYSSDQVFNPLCDPTLEAAAAAIKKSWEDFTRE